MTATIIDLDSRRRARAPRVAVIPADSAPLPDPWGQQDEPATATARRVVRIDSASDPYLTSEHIRRRRVLFEALMGFADRVDGFDRSVREVTEALDRLQAGLAHTLPSMSAERIHRIASDTSQRLTACAAHGGSIERLADRIANALMDSDTRAHRRGSRSPR